jgi:hypothetical protein
VGLADAVGAEALLYPQREIVATADLAARPYTETDTIKLTRGPSWND